MASSRSPSFAVTTCLVVLLCPVSFAGDQAPLEERLARLETRAVYLKSGAEHMADAVEDASPGLKAAMCRAGNATVRGSVDKAMEDVKFLEKEALSAIAAGVDCSKFNVSK
jgi:hypothetical protein